MFEMWLDKAIITHTHQLKTASRSHKPFTSFIFNLLQNKMSTCVLMRQKLETGRKIEQKLWLKKLKIKVHQTESSPLLIPCGTGSFEAFKMTLIGEKSAVTAENKVTLHS